MHRLHESPKYFYMLIGEYTHTLDDKRRLSLPAKFRKEMGKKMIVTQGLDSCLFVYSPSQWKQVSEKLAELPMGNADSRGFSRFMLAGAQEVEVDSAGRILISDYLKEFAGLKTKVILAGVYNRIEIWDEKTWNGYKQRTQKQADVLAEKLSELGAL